MFTSCYFLVRRYLCNIIKSVYVGINCKWSYFCIAVLLKVYMSTYLHVSIAQIGMHTQMRKMLKPERKVLYNKRNKTSWALTSFREIVHYHSSLGKEGPMQKPNKPKLGIVYSGHRSSDQRTVTARTVLPGFTRWPAAIQRDYLH